MSQEVIAIFLSSEWRNKVPDLVDQHFPIMKTREDLIRSALQLLHLFLHETAELTTVCSPRASIWYRLRDEPEYRELPFPFPFWKDWVWEEIEIDVDACVANESLPESIEAMDIWFTKGMRRQVSAIAQLAPELTSIFRVVCVALWLFDWVSAKFDEGSTFFLFYRATSKAKSIPFPL